MNISVTLLESAKRLVLIWPGVKLATKNQETCLKRQSDVTECRTDKKQNNKQTQAGHVSHRTTLQQQPWAEIHLRNINIINKRSLCSLCVPSGCCWLQGPVEQKSCAIPPFFLSCLPLCVSLCVSDPHPPPTWSLPSCRRSRPKPPSHPMLGPKPAHCQPNDCLDRPACQPVCLLHHGNMDRVSYSSTVKHNDVTLSSALMGLMVQSYVSVDITGWLHDHIKDGRFKQEHWLMFIIFSRV